MLVTGSRWPGQKARCNSLGLDLSQIAKLSSCCVFLASWSANFGPDGPLRSRTNTFCSFYMFSVTLRRVGRKIIAPEIMKVSGSFVSVLNCSS